MLYVDVRGGALPCDLIDFRVRHKGPIAEDTPCTVFLVMPMGEVLATKKLR